MIDTPLKNITADVDPELVQAFYHYLYQVAENDLVDPQIIIVDQCWSNQRMETSLSSPTG